MLTIELLKKRKCKCVLFKNLEKVCNVTSCFSLLSI